MTILIASHGRPESLVRTLSTIEACEKPPQYRGTVVVENGGRFATEEVVARFGEVRYLFHEIGNKSLALNFALPHIESGLVVYTDDDVRFSSAILTVYAEAFGRHGPEFFYGGRLMIDYELEPQDWLKKHLPRSVSGWSLGEQERLIDREEWFFGANWAADRDLVLGLGGFDQNYGPGSPTGARGQESQMQHRLQEAGHRGVYVPTATAWHFVAKDRCTQGWALERTRQHGLSVGLAIVQSGSWIKVVSWWVVYAAGVLIAEVARSLFSILGSNRNAFAFHRWREKFLGALEGMRSYKEGGSGDRGVAT